MKTKPFILAVIAFVAVTTLIEIAIASSMPVFAFIPVWVRRIESTPPTASSLNVYAGTHNINVKATGFDVIVRVNDITTPATNDTRKGRFSQISTDLIIKDSIPLIITPSPLPVVP